MRSTEVRDAPPHRFRRIADIMPHAFKGGCFAAAFCAFAALAATSASADSHGRAVPLAERVQGAQRVVVATARTVTPRWQQNEHGDRLIVSRVQLRVEETLKGAPANDVAMDIVGGTLDGYTLRVSGQAVVAPGDRAVFFLDADQPNTFVPHLRGEGVLHLDADDVVKGTSLKLSDIRSAARAVRP